MLSAILTPDIWEDNAASRKKHRRSWPPSCLRSRTRVNFADMTAVKTCDGFCCRRLVFSYRNGIADSTGRRVGVMSQVAPRHMRTGLNARPLHLQEKVSQRQVRRQLRRCLCIKFVSLFWEDRRGLATTQTQYWNTKRTEFGSFAISLTWNNNVILVLWRVVTEKEHVVFLCSVNTVRLFTSFVIYVAAVFVIKFDEFFDHVHPFYLLKKTCKNE